MGPPFGARLAPALAPAGGALNSERCYDLSYSDASTKLTTEPATATNLSIIIPTYRRERVLIDTIEALLQLEPQGSEILVIDQSASHEPAVAQALQDLVREGRVRLSLVQSPSIPAAMNLGLRLARGKLALFVDDDIRPAADLIHAHLVAAGNADAALIAGRVIQPWSTEPVLAGAGSKQGFVEQFIGCNFSVDRKIALELGGFDENFARAAYRFEVEFAYRWRRSGRRIFYEPRACLHHLKCSSGGTRAHSNHLRTARPDHAVGEYYCLLRTWRGWPSLRALMARPFKAIATRHHLRAPWWIPVTLVGEIRAAAWAISLALRGPKFAQPC
jgi:GT2 family glycosyltransferase